MQDELRVRQSSAKTLLFEQKVKASENPKPFLRLKFNPDWLFFPRNQPVGIDVKQVHIGRESADLQGYLGNHQICRV
jgi:hypothetical protein